MGGGETKAENAFASIGDGKHACHSAKWLLPRGRPDRGKQGAQAGSREQGRAQAAPILVVNDLSVSKQKREKAQ